MNVIFLYFSLLGLILAFPQPPDIDDELSDLPFNTDNFPSTLDEPSLKEDVRVDEIFSRHLADESLEQRLKMKDMFADRGPPSIGLDIFDAKTVEDNVLAYEGSGVGVDDNVMEIENLVETTTESAKDPSDLSEVSNYSSENATSDEAVLSMSNSSVLLDQNTSDFEVETISEDDLQQETKVVVEAELNTNTNKSETPIYGDNENIVANVIQSASESKGPCPVPRFCGKNCFVYVNEDGCQDCQCLWTSLACKTDKDCSDVNQYCDLGKCNCQPGYRQNMKKTGVCEIDPKFSFGKLQLSNAEDRQLNLKDITKQISGVSRFKRENKPRRAERLEWPGRMS